VTDVPVGQRAANLPWLCPAGASFLALTADPPDARVLAADPAAVLLLLRFVRPTPSAGEFRLDALPFTESILPEAAARYLSTTTTGRLDRSHGPTAELVHMARSAARVAAGLASRTRTVTPATASAAALLCPLGWFLVAATDRLAVTTCLEAIRGGEEPAAAQYRLWGLTHDGIARRAAARWRLPDWMAAVIGNPGLPTDVAVRLGAPRGLTEVVRAAIAACDAGPRHFGLARPNPKPTDLELTRLAKTLSPAAGPATRPTTPGEAVIPDSVLIPLLGTVARVRRAEAAGRLERLHGLLDRAVDQLRDEGERFDARLRDAKLAALAEVAAGAGHEINNPLAVVSGNAQQLLARTIDPDSRQALETIIRQSRRISGIVSDMMQYARPHPPTVRPFELGECVGRIVEDCRQAVAAAGVDVGFTPPRDPIHLTADPVQVGRALATVIRNGVEASQPGGWVRVAVARLPGRAAVVVEDGGPGPTGPIVDHMFDPFFSGRNAGRGRGLGLPTAWRLMRQNGGDVRYEPTEGGPTRFVLELPLPQVKSEPYLGRKSA
jgi:signal transduction histidine kinase